MAAREQTAVSAAARELAARQDPDALAEPVFQEILHRCYADYAEDEAFCASLRESVYDNIRALVHLVAGRLDIDATSPSGALAFAGLSAALDIHVSTLERAYLVGTGRFWQEWLAIATAEAIATDEPLEDYLREPTALMFAYIDHVLGSVVSQYDEARTDMVRTREHLRRATLAQILSGPTDTDPTELERALGYTLRSTHLGLCVQTSTRAAADRLAATLRTAADAAEQLVHQRGAQRYCIWLGRPGGFGSRELLGLRRALADADAHAAVGEPWPGLAGLVRTFEEAEMAADVQQALGVGGDAVLAYRDVRLEALLLADEERARRFVSEELGPLAGADPRLARIRETLLVWLAHGTHVAAAALLGLHENTVRNRIRQAEELLPGIAAGRRTELQVALRLERVLGARAS